MSEDLFQVMGIPVLTGGTFSEGDLLGPPWSVVVNEALAREAFAGEDAVGRRLALWGTEVEIIGVVGDVRQASLRDPPVPTLYLHQEMVPRSAMTFVLRTGGNPLLLAGAARQVVTELEPNQAITAIESVEDVVSGSAARARFITVLLILHMLTNTIEKDLFLTSSTQFVLLTERHKLVFCHGHCG